MKLLKLIGILLIVILMSPDTFAHCKGKHADNPPPGHCDGGGSGETNEYIFHVDIPSGVFTTFYNDGQDSRPQSITNGSKSVIFSPRQTKPMSFKLTDFWTHVDRDYIGEDYVGDSLGSYCFGDLINNELNGSLHLNEFEGSQISIAVFWFRGKAQDATTDIKYVLELHDDNYDGWLPNDGDSYEFPPVNTTMNLNATSWEMRTEGKGELKKGPCVGSGEFEGEDFVYFSLYRQPPEN